MQHWATLDWLPLCKFELIIRHVSCVSLCMISSVFLCSDLRQVVVVKNVLSFPRKKARKKVR